MGREAGHRGDIKKIVALETGVARWRSCARASEARGVGMTVERAAEALIAGLFQGRQMVAECGAEALVA